MNDDFSYDEWELRYEDDPYRSVGFASSGDIFLEQHERITAIRESWPTALWDDPWTIDERRAKRLAEMPYSGNLLTPEWKAKRYWMIRHGVRSCVRCGAYKTSFHVHHLTYERRGNELPEDLELLCADCHRGEHGIAA